TTGHIGTGTVDDDMDGLIEATGAGVIDELNIGGELDGLVSVPEDLDENGDPILTTGIIDEFNIGSIGEDGTITTGYIGTGTVDDDMNGLIEATGAGQIDQ